MKILICFLMGAFISASAVADTPFAAECSVTKLYRFSGANPEMRREIMAGISLIVTNKSLGQGEERYQITIFKASIGDRSFSSQIGNDDYFAVRSSKDWIEAIFGRSEGYAHYRLVIEDNGGQRDGRLFFKGDTHRDDRWTKLADLSCD